MKSPKPKLELKSSVDERSPILESFHELRNVSNNVEMRFYEDGAISFFQEDENFVYFYPEQVPHIKAALRKWDKMQKSKKAKVKK